MVRIAISILQKSNSSLRRPQGQWYTMKAPESDSVIMEVKDGKCEPQGEGYTQRVFHRMLTLIIRDFYVSLLRYSAFGSGMAT